MSPASVCVVGGGPAGAVLSFLLARRGVPVTLLEAAHDFEREFRGDTLHPSVMEVMDQLGLAEKIFALPHVKVSRATLATATSEVTVADFTHLDTKYPFITLVPQHEFLKLVTEEAKRFPSFNLVLGANARALLQEGGRVCGVVADREHRATLTVAADGRASRLRKLAGMEPIEGAPPMDIAWFRVPRHQGDPPQEAIRFLTGGGHFLVMFDRGQAWQVGFVFRKGGFGKLRDQGMAAFRASVAALVPFFAERLEALTDFSQLSLLTVRANRLERWHRPGLLFIGDAAHAMTPVGGVGINLAIQDAVEAANVLTGPLLEGGVTEQHLAAVQRRRSVATRVMQTMQAQVQRQVLAETLDESRVFELPWLARMGLKLPLLRVLPARLVGLGVSRVRLET